MLDVPEEGIKKTVLCEGYGYACLVMEGMDRREGYSVPGTDPFLSPSDAVVVCNFASFPLSLSSLPCTTSCWDFPTRRPVQTTFKGGCLSVAPLRGSWSSRFWEMVLFLNTQWEGKRILVLDSPPPTEVLDAKKTLSSLSDPLPPFKTESVRTLFLDKVTPSFCVSPASPSVVSLSPSFFSDFLPPPLRSDSDVLRIDDVSLPLFFSVRFGSHSLPSSQGEEERSVSLSPLSGGVVFASEKGCARDFRFGENSNTLRFVTRLFPWKVIVLSKTQTVALPVLPDSSTNSLMQLLSSWADGDDAEKVKCSFLIRQGWDPLSPLLLTNPILSDLVKEVVHEGGRIWQSVPVVPVTPSQPPPLRPNRMLSCVK